MGIETLRQNLIAEAQAGQISINAATFTAAALEAPPDLDALLKSTFLDIDIAAGLPITTSTDQIGPIEDGTFFYMTGTIDVTIAKKKDVKIKFGAQSAQGTLVIGIDLGGKWNFSESFLSLLLNIFLKLKAKDPYFFFAGQEEASYPWANTSVRLEPGLNFAGDVPLTGYLGAIGELLPGFIPVPAYKLSGTVDPSQKAPVTPESTDFNYPGLKLRTEPFTTDSYNFGFLTISDPYLWITLVDYGEEIGLLPAVMLSASLSIPGNDTPVAFRTSIPATSTTKIVGFSLVPLEGSFVISADQIFQLMGGQTWYGLFPPSLSTFLQSFGFVSFGAMVSYESAVTLDTVEAVILSLPWRVLDDPLLELEFEFDWTIQSPLQTNQSQYASLTATASFMPELFPGKFHFTIDTNLLVSGGYTAADPSEYVSFNALAEAITGGFIKVPEQFITILFQEFNVSINQPARAYTFACTTSIKLPVVGEGKFELNDVELWLSVQKPEPSGGQPVAASPAAFQESEALAEPGAGTRYTGSITGSLIVGPLFLFVECIYIDEVWTFSLAMQPDTELSLQQLIDSIFDDVQLPTDIFKVDVTISDVALKAVVPSNKNLATTYSGSGSIRWEFEILSQKIDTLAKVSLTYNAKAVPSRYTGSVTATTTFDIFGIGATFTVGYEIKNESGKPQATEVVFLTWQGLTARYIQGSGQKIFEFTADNTWNLGRLISTLVQIVNPTLGPELPTPWNLLNNVSLSGLKITFNLDTKQVTVSWPLRVKLFFAEIESLNIIKNTNKQVEVTLTGKFLFTNTNDVKWDAVNQNPPQVPGGGDSAFDLRLLALGQRVTVPDLAAIKTVNDAVNQLTGFVPPPPASRIVPVGPGIPPTIPGSQTLQGGMPETALVLVEPHAAEPKPPVFSPDSNWLIGTHFFAVSGMLDLKAIFNDPVLYGLRIALAGPKAKIFAGLEFEILYKKITDSIGMYKLMLKLPDAMRYLQFGQVTVILPIVSIEIYTNGNFKIDFGFPYNMDFSVSFTVQIFPFTGSGGFYFGWLNGATSSQVPQNTTCGTFTPVVEFGIGMQVGLGKSVSIGILRAEVAITVFGILEGVVATWRAYDNSDLLIAGAAGARLLFGPDTRALAAAGGNANIENQYYYKITGTLGVVGRIVGVVDFAIVKAEVSLTVYAYIKGTFEAFRKTVITMEAGVRVSLRFTINCGLFKITIGLSFSARIKEVFTIGTDRVQQAPWFCGGSTAALLQAPPPMSLMEAVRLFAVEPNFGPLKTPEGGPRTLAVYFLPQLSISGEGAENKQDQAAVYSINLFISNELQKVDADAFRPFERLMRDTYLWIASSFSGRETKGTPDEELQEVASLPQMQAALEYLTSNSDGRSLTYDQVAANLAALFIFNIQLPPPSANMEDASEGVQTSAWPMPPELALTASYKGATIADVEFASWATATDAYLQDLQERINRLIAQMLDELERQNDEHAEARKLLRQEAVDEESLATFVFVDYFAMAAQYLVQAAIDTFDNYAYLLEDGDSIASIRQKFNAIGGGQNTLTDEQIAWSNREHPVTPKLNLTINSVPYRIQAGDTWGAIAASHGLDPGQVASDNALVEQVLIPGRPITIDQQIHTVPNDGSIASTASEFGITPRDLGKAIADTPDLVQPLTVITLNGLARTTSAAEPDTIVRLAQDYGIEVQALTPSIAGIANLLDRTMLKTVILPGLRALSNDDLWNDILAHSGVEHLSGMAARYLLGGLRLPVAGINFKDPNHPCAQEETCGLQNLTGQQFELPSLADYNPEEPLIITLANPEELPWITFTNPADPADPSQIVFNLPKEAAGQVNALLDVAQGDGLQAPIKPPEPLDLVRNRARQFTFSNSIILQTAVELLLPNNDLPKGTTPRPQILNFPAALVAELGRPVALDPRFVIQIGSTNTEGGRVIPRPALAYGFGTLINVAIKRVIVSEGGTPVSPTTYELVGADEIGINQLEQLLGVITPENVSIINQIYIVYQPNQTSDRAEGLQYDGDQNYATFLVRANLSSETNPPTGNASLRLLTEAEPRGLLNSPYEFLSELWSGSIVRSGGYYFVYELANGSGLPPSLFNEDNIANISVLIVYNPIDGITGANGGVLKRFMNAAVINDPVDNSSDVLYLESLPREAKVTMLAGMSLADIAAAYHLGVIEVAASNLSHLLRTGASVAVTDIVHQVGRGETLEQIAKYFGTTTEAIIALNPHVDFANLTAGTGLHIPDLTTSPATGSPGSTLPEIAHHYNTTVPALVWANRNVEGLYTSAPPLIFGDMLLDRESTLPPGNVGITVTRDNPGGDQTNPAVYLEQEYNLLGYDVIDNTDCTVIADALPLPSTPATDETEEELAQPRMAAPAAAAADEPWVYTFTVPAARAARNNPVPESIPGSPPYPDRGMNPYAGVGGFIQLSLDWRDMMGNRTWSRFDDQSPANNYPLNDPPSRMGFTDDVIGLGQWSSTHFDHFFDAGLSGPRLNIEWSFDPSRYDKDQPPVSGDDMPTWERNAKSDRQVFANLYYQLIQTDRDGAESTVMETLTSLADNQAQFITSQEAEAVRDYVLAAWRYVVKVLENEGEPPPLDLPRPVHIERSIDASQVGAITEVSAAFQMRRPDRAILGEFRDEGASRLATTVIGPRLVKVEQPGENPGYTLDWYTRHFQEAFNTPGFELRLATGVSRHDLGAGRRRDTLWAVRFGKSAGQFYYYRIENPAMFFAPAPLSTVLISRPDVTLYSFSADRGLSPKPDVIQTFTGIDLDVWGRTVLAGIDQLLSPQYAVPAFLVDDKGGTTYLQQVLDTKFKLARSIVQGVTNILCKPRLDPETNKANFDAAREKLRQQLLIQLENAYIVDAVVQYDMAVTAPASATDEKTVPRLYGNPLEPNQTNIANDYAASSFKVPLANGSSLLTYTFRARDKRRQSSFRLSLEYRPTHIEHQITSVPGIEEYQASSWLNFLDRLPAIDLVNAPDAAIDIEIPIPLRAYPAPPSLQNQAFLQDDTGTSPETTLEKAKEWTFRFIYAQPQATQDRIDSVIRFNVPAQSIQARLAAPPVDLVVMLARIIHVLGQVQTVFEQDLLNVKLNTPLSSTTFKRAQNALSAFAALTNGLDVAWSEWVTARDNASMRAATLNQELPFSILQDPMEIPVVANETLRVLRVTVIYPTTLLPGIAEPPIVTFEGYTPEEVSPEESLPQSGTADEAERRPLVRAGASTYGVSRLMGEDTCEAQPIGVTSRKAWIYKRDVPGEPPYLTWDEALEMADRRVDVKELDAIQYQNAWANVRIIRNLDLVGAENPTREPFVYRTPAVQFRNTLTPLLDTSKEINIAKVPTGSIEHRTLAGHLTALFQAFFKGSPSQAQIVKLETRYSYALSDMAGAPQIELPVLMLPPTEFQIPPDWQALGAAPGSIDTNTFIETLALRIKEWYEIHQPSPQTASFLFDLSAFTSLSNNTQPLVRVRNLLLPTEDITDLKA